MASNLPNTTKFFRFSNGKDNSILIKNKRVSASLKSDTLCYISSDIYFLDSSKDAFLNSFIALSIAKEL